MRISDWSSDVCSSDLVALADVLDDREAEAGATDRAAARLIDAVETFGQAGQMFGCDAVALVADRQPHPVSLAHQLDRDRRSRMAIFHGVRNDVVRELPELRTDRKSTRLNSSP